MAHERKRHAAAMVFHIAKLSPLVGVLGHRQVGKTTLLSSIGKQYFSFDDEELLAEAQHSSKRFLESRKSLGTVIDECQLVENLFPALKERVRLDRRPGQFFLSGSVRFTSKKLIRESLTGRIMNVELLPLTLSELDRRELPNTLQSLMQTRRFDLKSYPQLKATEHGRRTRLIEQYDVSGGLPGACFIRNPGLQTQKLIAQLETVLDRDLRQIHPTTLTLPELLRFVRAVAAQDGDTLQYEELKRITGIMPSTQKKLLFALEATFVVRHIPIEGDFSGSAILFEDHGEVGALARRQLTDEQRWNGLIYRNLREQIFYRIGENADFFQYRTRGGVRVPIAIRTQGSVIGFIPIHGEPDRTSAAAARSFLQRYGNGLAVIVTDQNITRALNERTLLTSATQLLF